LGHSRGSFSTKINVAINGDGGPVKLCLTKSQRHDVTCMEAPLERLELKYVTRDKGDDRDLLCERIRSTEGKPVIP
jgi:hypothetical protein